MSDAAPPAPDDPHYKSNGADAPASDDARASTANSPRHKQRRAIDPWRHRRTEPRLMALLWAMYLFFAAIETIFSVRVLGMRDAGLFLPTSRALLALLAMGVVLLWPMARLSQASPARPLRAAAADIIAIALPALAVVAPLKLLTEWPWDVMAGLGAMMLSWSLLIGALLAKGTARPPKKARTGWMLLCLAMVAAAPLAQLLLQSLGVSAPPMGLLSPLTGVFELTSAPSGLVPSMSISDWLGVAAPAVVAIPAWALAALSVASGGDRPSPA